MITATLKEYEEASQRYEELIMKQLKAIQKLKEELAKA